MSWPVAALGDVAPAKPAKLKNVNPRALIWQVTLDHIESNTGRLLKKSIKPLSEAGSSTHAFDGQHVLYSKLRPYLNKVLLPSSIGLGTSELVPMLPDPSRLDRNYLAHYLKSNDFVGWVSSQTAGAKMPRVSMKIFWDHQIPLPPLKEQKRIAAILDRADAIRRKRQQAIDLTDQLLRAVFLELFGDPVTNPKGWESIPLHEVADIRSGITKGRKTREKVLSAIPYMRVANVQDAHITLDDVATIAVTKEEQERYKLLKNDILLTEGGDPDKLGRGAVWKGEVDPCIHQNHIFCVRIKDNTGFTPYYLSTLIGSKYGKRYFLREAKQTTGIATINKSQLKEFPVLVAPKKLQNKFDEYLVIFSSYKTNYEALLNQQSNLFSSLAQQAFHGELTKQTEVA